MKCLLWLFWMSALKIRPLTGDVDKPRPNMQRLEGVVLHYLARIPLFMIIVPLWESTSMLALQCCTQDESVISKMLYTHLESDASALQMAKSSRASPASPEAANLGQCSNLGSCNYTGHIISWIQAWPQKVYLFLYLFQTVHWLVTKASWTEC